MTLFKKLSFKLHFSKFFNKTVLLLSLTNSPIFIKIKLMVENNLLIYFVFLINLLSYTYFLNISIDFSHVIFDVNFSSWHNLKLGGLSSDVSGLFQILWRSNLVVFDVSGLKNDIEKNSSQLGLSS